MLSEATSAVTALGLSLDDGLGALIALARAVAQDTNASRRSEVVRALVAVIDSGIGDNEERVTVGEILGALGDPRLRLPSDPDYWVHVSGDDVSPTFGRFAVTNFEYRRFVETGGYDDDAHWDEDGRAWRDATPDPWPARASRADVAVYVIPNQPVVGVTWYEAMAYATAHSARLPRFDERLWVVRGANKRPYPWGSPFGEGNANTREEVVGRPCAVGLFVRDVTPEGVRDLAGNVAEWTAEGVGDTRWIHPGAWDQPSMAAWAKARSLESSSSRWAGLGFRLARD